MTAKEVYEKMILGEISPSNALDYFYAEQKSESVKQAREAELIAAGFPVPNNIESLKAQLAARIRTGDEVLIYRAERALKEQQIIDEHNKMCPSITDFINAAQKMIARQEKEKPPETHPEEIAPAIEAGPEPTEQGLELEHELFSLFPEFKKHSAYLKKHEYYEIAGDNLHWKHGGNVLLAGYFGMIQEIPGIPRKMWADIERAFNVRSLAQYYREYETMRTGKTAKHDRHDKELRDLVSGKIVL